MNDLELRRSRTLSGVHGVAVFPALGLTGFRSSGFFSLSALTAFSRILPNMQFALAPSELNRLFGFFENAIAQLGRIKHAHSCQIGNPGSDYLAVVQVIGWNVEGIARIVDCASKSRRQLWFKSCFVLKNGRHAESAVKSTSRLTPPTVKSGTCSDEEPHGPIGLAQWNFLRGRKLKAVKG